MNAQELVTRYRTISKDNAKPFFSSDSKLLALFNEMEQEACRRALLLFDRTTEAICQKAVVASTARYAVSPLIVEFHKIYLVSGSDYYYPKIVDQIELDAQYPLWREASSDIKTRFVLIDEDGYVTLVPTPSASMTMYMEVYRLPSADMTIIDVDGASATTSPEIAAQHHKHLVHGVLEYVYSEKDSDRRDPKKAEEYGDLFSDYFGPPVDARKAKKTRSNRPHRNKLW